MYTHFMRKLGRNMKAVKVVMMMALLFCLFLCPHGADAFQDACPVCEPGIECRGLCDCQDHHHNSQHECALDALHSHTFRDDTSLTFCLDIDHLDWAHAALFPDEPQRSFRNLSMVARVSSHTFAVRHLDTIILRV